MSEKQYSYLETYAHVMGNSEYDALDREETIDILDATIHRPRMKNICLVAEPGMGKTQVVDTWAKRRKNEITTYEIDVESLGGVDTYKFGERIKGLVSEIEHINTNEQKRVAMFVDEVHVLGRPEYSIALEALKPAMTNGKIIFIGATTDEEYIQYIDSNAALTDRFEKLNLPEVSRETILKILKTMWEKELPDEEVVDETLLNTIIDYGVYKPSQSQPRKAIKMLDDLIGWFRTKDVMLNEALLDQRIYSTTGINPKLKINLNNVEEKMRQRIKGQDFAIQVLINSLNIGVAGLQDPTRPMGSFIFMGPTGVGKTEIAKCMAEGLFGHEDNMVRFDMSEYQHGDSVEKFRDQLSDKVQKKPYNVYLFDEIEKAHRGIMDLFLQILDDGRLSNRYGRQVTFRRAYIIFTTNIGHKDFEEGRKTSQNLIENIPMASRILQRADAFRSELVNRIDAIIPFMHLSRDVRNSIASKRLEELKDTLKQRNIALNYSPKVVEYITREISDENTTSGGGRDINRKVFDNVTVLVAKLINNTDSNRLQELNIDVFGAMRIEHKQKLKSEAFLGISEYKIKTKEGFTEIYKGDLSKNIQATDKRAQVQQLDNKSVESNDIVENMFNTDFLNAHTLS